MGNAVSEGKTTANPCVIHGAGAPTAHDPPRVAGRAGEADAGMPEQYRAMVLLASWCGLRFGELTELRRRDIVLDRTGGVNIVAPGVVLNSVGLAVGTAQCDAGVRTWTSPAPLIPLAGHLATLGHEPVGLLFPPTRWSPGPVHAEASLLRPRTLVGRPIFGSTTCGRPERCQAATAGVRWPS